MLRISSIAARQLGAGSERIGAGIRHASTGQPSGGLAKAMAGTALFSAGVGGGVLGYAAIDQDFRKLVQDNVPGSEDVMKMILGDTEPSKPNPVSKPVPSKLKIPGPVVVTKPLEKSTKAADTLSSKADEVVTAVSSNSSASNVVPEPPPKVVEKVEYEDSTKSVKVEEPQRVDPAPVLEIPHPEPPVEAVEKDKAQGEISREPEEAVALPPDDQHKQEFVASRNTEEKPVSLPDVTEKEIEHGELTPDVENTSLEQVLHELSKEMKAATEEAVKTLDLSAQAVVTHINIMQKVLESNPSVRDENSWNMVFEAASAKSDASKLAELKEKEVNAAINNVLESIDAGRKNKATSTNPELIVAEEAVNRALYQLEQAKARISAVEGEARVVEQYRDLVEEGTQQFQREMASIMPDVKLREKGSKLSDDELNLFITHAYRKVMHLQQELAKQQTLEQQRFKQALEKQRIETQLAATEKIDTELERQKRELEIDHQRRLASLQEESEGELRTQLRRQAAAHSDHLADVLTVQEAELRRKHEHDLDEKLSAKESKYLSHIAGLTGSLQGLNSALEARAVGDEAAVNAQKLWLACVALNNSIKLGNVEAETFFESAKALEPEVSAIKDIAGSSEFVRAVINGIPETALNRGVYTQQALTDRFGRVESVARKVANVGDEGGSLMKYGLSYLQSLLLVNTAKRSPKMEDEPISVNDLSTVDILTKASHSMERGDILRALQYMGLLRGEPRRVASDWMSEARLHLEAKQAAQALLAHATAVGLEALPKKIK